MSAAIGTSQLVIWFKTFQSRGAPNLSNLKQSASSSQSTSKRHTSTHRGACKLVNHRIHRCWNHVKEQPSRYPSHDVSVLSYNILAKNLLEKNSWLYTNCDQSALDWNFRWRNLSNELKSFNSDIVCLQEVEDYDLERDIGPYLESLGYTTDYKKRTGDDLHDGVLTAVKSDNFNVVSVVPVDYFRPHDPLTDRENVGLISVLEMKSSDVAIVVCNTHLLYNPKRGDVKLVQLCTFFAEIDKVVKQYASRYKRQPAVIMCGDFNSTPVSPLFHFVTFAKLFYESIPRQAVSGQGNGNFAPKFLPIPLLPDVLNISKQCQYSEKACTASKSPKKNGKKDENKQPYITHNIGLMKSCNHQHRESEATTTQDTGITVDYIFYSLPNNLTTNISTTQLALKARLSIPHGDQIRQVGSIPNQVHSSDHLPVAALFSVSARPQQHQPSRSKSSSR